MNEFDLDALGDLWRAPDPAEMERLRRAADAAARRARWGQLTDFLLAGIVSVIVILLVISNPSRVTAVVGGAAILLMLSTNIRQRQLRKVELQGLAGTTEEMLDQSIERVTATLKRNRFGLFGAAPGFLVGIGFGAALESGDGSGIVASLTSDSLLPKLIAAGILAGLVALTVHLYFTVRRNREELARLKAMRDAFRSESEAAE